MNQVPEQQGVQTLELAPQQDRPVQTIAPVGPVSPMSMIQSALDRGASMDQIDRLIALKERMEAEEARRAFVAATVAFKAEGIVVIRDKRNDQYGSQYASIGQLVNTANPFLSKHQLSADWDIDQSNGLEVSCILSHALGHQKRVTLKVPPDTSGAKNPLQQIKSALTYARSLTFEAVCGLASEDQAVNPDDDGNGSGAPQQRKPAAAPKKPGQQANEPSKQLLKNARESADKGRARFSEFWKDLTGAQRNSLRDALPDLEARCNNAEASAAPGADFARQMDVEAAKEQK